MKAQSEELSGLLHEVVDVLSRAVSMYNKRVSNDKTSPRKWDYRKSVFDSYCVYEGDSYIAQTLTEEYARLITAAPELYWGVYNLLYELKQGSGSSPEYVKQVIPQLEEILSRANGDNEAHKAYGKS